MLFRKKYLRMEMHINYYLPPQSVEELEKVRNITYTFAFFRNPFIHLASCYCNLIYGSNVERPNLAVVYEQLGIAEDRRYVFVFTLL